MTIFVCLHKLSVCAGYQQQHSTAYEMMNGAINPYVRRTNQSHLDCPLSVLQCCHSPSFPSMIAIPPLHIANSLSLSLLSMYVYMSGCLPVKLAYWQGVTSDFSLLNQQEVFLFSPCGLFRPDRPHVACVRPERSSPKTCLCSSC